MTLTDTRPTQMWLHATAGFMPPLEGPAGTAERLLLLLHYSIDWDTSWVAGYRTTYWDKLLPDRILVASQQAANLRQWWTQLADDLQAFPTTATARHELAQLLDTPDPMPVLRVLRQETLALVLRTRIVAETRKHR
ncbi:hypothetical protein H5398_15505 [Tessaracoccus sp. MC1679]|uniref:hypothetical protein n=1 Tax=Tessaracoccus sp. MC1679 TaxID=2760313 RepID=UPI00160244A1|nr:hypothetical protein [Tessaracoccus sp. MC1679]MBB1517361.1 hypothetical protein [Tessaracoccus sp. MC1679]HQZ85626.1 hypothetical protein [Actinomycetota bacterium]